MDSLMVLFTAVVIIAAALAGIAVWAPRAVPVKLAALALAASLMPVGHFALVDLLGKPKPQSLEWALGAVPGATVLSAELRENEAIFLWLRFDSVPEPRAYALPWSMARARQLHEAMARARAEGGAVRMRGPFASARDPQEPMFHAEPQPPLPPKTVTPKGGRPQPL